MSDALLQPELAACLFLGLGGVLLGLAAGVRGGALLRSRRTLAGPVALLLAAVACMGLGQPRGIWLAPLSLAALWVVGHVALSPLLDQVGAVLAWLRRPSCLATTLLTGSALLLVALSVGGKDVPDAAEETPPALVIPTERYGLRAETGKRVVTDCGRRIHLLVRTLPVPLVPELLARERTLLRPHLLNTGLVRLAPPSADCNCHGWVFLDGRYWLPTREVELILRDNGYQPVTDPHPGDLVIYRAPDGEAGHSGVVLALDEGGRPLVESKWADLGCYVHRADMPFFGRHQFFRSARTGHLLAGVREAAGSVAAAGTASRTH
jgi:hypothetical protein